MDDPSDLSDCFTCMRKTDNFLRICDEANIESVDRILARHFWFERKEYELSVLCTSCWEKIDEFHKFYCEVANVHQVDALNFVKVEGEETKKKRGRKRKKAVEEEQEDDDEEWKPPAVDLGFPVPVHVKLEVTEPDLEEREVFAVEHQQIKRETVAAESEDDDDESEEDDEEESDEESSKPIAARRRQVKKPRRRGRRSTQGQKDAVILQHLEKLGCDQCSEEFDSFGKLEKHCRQEHDSAPNVVCCNRAYQKLNGLYQHVCRHKNLFKYRCKECDRCFKNVDGLNMHNLLHHTPEEEKRFRCHQCDTAFASELLLTSHLNWHATVEPKNIICHKCNKYFTNTKMLENHTLTHHPELLDPEAYQTEPEAVNYLQEQHSVDESQIPDGADSSFKKPQELAKPIRRKTTEESVVEDDLIRKYCSLNCESCDFIGPTFSKLQVHYKNEHDAQGFAVCCARKFSKKSRLYEHVCVHENPDHFKCQVCAKTFQNSFGLSNHMMWKHTPDSEKPFRCDVCGNRFWKDYLLKQHMEYHLALEEKKYACKECDRFFGTSLLLKSHEQTVHGLSASWVCDICAKGFPLKSALEFHRQQHTQEGRAAQKAQCKYCSLWMKNVRSLRSHLKRCKSDPVSCDICGKECSNAFSLQSHKKFVHSNAPMYSCSFCAKPFKRLLRLREHEAGHTGDLLYKCEYCPRTCNSSSNMYTHKKVAHPEQWAEKVASRFHKR
ncbi:transcription factor grauzone [Aedes aegypti]|uniref:C2H2-type domain-containing protein n=1 Tax=Aedes aegypti TaxID=7159 RepID=A0A6I8UA18_AEDAE|nr:transcription factor grauzone [Aedes aegypti]